MDNLSLLVATVVGISELILVYLVIFAFLEGKELKNKLLDKTILIQFIATIIIHIFTTYFCRRLVGIIYMPFITLSYLILVFSFVFKYNLRQTCIGSYIGFSTLMIADICSLPLLKISYVSGLISFHNRILVTVPSRLIQIIILIIIIKISDDIPKQYAEEEWDVLSKQSKYYVIILIVIILTSTLFLTNYMAFQLKIKINLIDVNSIYYNTFIVLINSLIVFIIVLISFVRTQHYDEYKDLLQNPELLMNNIINESTYDEILEYSVIAKDFLEYISYKNIKKCLDMMCADLLDFSYHIDPEIESIDIDLRYILNFLEVFLMDIIIQTNYDSVAFDLIVDEKVITANYLIYLNDIERKKIEKQINKNLDIENLKFALIDQGNNFSYKINSTTLSFTISIKI